MNKSVIVKLSIACLLFTFIVGCSKKTEEPRSGYYLYSSNENISKIAYSLENYDVGMVQLISKNMLNQEITLYPVSTNEELANLIKGNEVETYILKEDTFNVKIKHSYPLIEQVPIENVDLEKYDKPLNIYLAGIDTREGGPSDPSLTDANMILTINPKSKKILLTSIPRDFAMSPSCTNNQMDKFSHLGMYGIECSIDGVISLTHLNIDYYIRTNFGGFTSIIETFGSVDVNNTVPFVVNNYQFVEGVNTLEAANALDFVRARKGLPGGDRYRIGSQQNLVEGMLNKLYDQKTILFSISKLPTLFSFTQTNVPQDLFVALLMNQLENNEQWVI